MPTFLSDPSPTLYLILGVITVVLGVLALRSKRKRETIAFVIFALLLVGPFVCDKLFDSPREHSIKTMKQIQDASAAKNWDVAFGQISDSFRYNGPTGDANIDKKKLRAMLHGVEPMIEKGLFFRDFHRDDFRMINETHLEMGFSAGAVGIPQSNRFVVGIFVLDPDGEWRLQGFRIYESAQSRDGQEQGIPGVQ